MNPTGALLDSQTELTMIRTWCGARGIDLGWSTNGRSPFQACIWFNRPTDEIRHSKSFHLALRDIHWLVRASLEGWTQRHGDGDAIAYRNSTWPAEFRARKANLIQVYPELKAVLS